MSGAVRQHPLAPQAVDVALPLDRVLRIANEYERNNRYDDAEQLLEAILAACPCQPDALHLLGVIAFRRGGLEDACRLMEQAIHQDAASSVYLRNICTVYEQLGRFDKAIAAGQRAIELDPYDPDAHHNLAVVHQRLLQLDQAIAHAARAVSLAPGLAAPHFALAESLLLRGEFSRGWEEYEWRFRVPGAEQPMPATGQPQWDGTPGPGPLLLIADQGFGDVILFSRYLAWVRQRRPNVMLACGPPMQRLMRHNFPWLRLFTQWSECPGFDVYCPLSGLPRLHCTVMDTIPAVVPYLSAEPDAAAAWRRRLERLLPGSAPRIGVAWAGRPRPPNRSISLQSLVPIGALDGISLVSLQTGSPLDEIGSYYGRAPLINLGHALNDFSDTASVIAGLDLVITIDTAVAHLAGAMGKPVWVLLQYAPDWRWLLRRDDSPWYPTGRLFRQPAPRHWEPVIAAVAAALGDWIG